MQRACRAGPIFASNLQVPIHRLLCEKVNERVSFDFTIFVYFRANAAFLFLVFSITFFYVECHIDENLNNNCDYFLSESCTVAPDFEGMANGCRGFYSFFNEDTGQYDPGWKYLSNESLYNPPFTYKSWEYATSTELDTYPFVGAYLIQVILKILQNAIDVFRH